MNRSVLRAGIAMGSNIEPCLQRLQAAREFLLTLHEGGPFLMSSIYVTEPVDCAPGTPAFRNAVSGIATSLEPRKLMECLQAYEISQGRPTDHGKNTPRTIDMDLLFLGDITSADPDILLPHPRATSRAFVMVPLAEICPDLVLPGHSETVQILCSRLNARDLQSIMRS
jgi:2-amino-4-hydroxy-6-hydroxymethyldihydropteridine diphosphokinase